jgi:phosphoribosylaminoimidazole-succinocarboxamide synthase
VTAISDLPLIASGKVREIYDLGDTLLIAASDRISTYDVVHPTPIPDKGNVLTGLSTFWFERTSQIVPNHLISVTDGVPDEVRGRAMVVRKLEMLPVECVVRGYLSGSGWKDYQRTGAVSGIELPSGLRESDQLPEPIFTPSTKAPLGEHDEPITYADVESLAGTDVAARLRELTLAVYARGAEIAARTGILVADTKLEFGRDPATAEIVLADEVLTPDSSRFWPADRWEPGRPQFSFDKQFVRDWSATLDWDRTAPGPEVPPDVVAATRARYVDVYERITGLPWAQVVTLSQPPSM